MDATPPRRRTSFGRRGSGSKRTPPLDLESGSRKQSGGGGLLGRIGLTSSREAPSSSRPREKKSTYRNPLDLNGDGVVDSSDFIPSFLDRDGDGKISLNDGVHDVKKQARKHANDYMRAKVEQMYVNMYIQKLKPSMTGDWRMPWMVRKLIHELTDEVWEQIRIELPRSLDKVLGEADVEENKKPRGRNAMSSSTMVPSSPPPSPPYEAAFEMAAAPQGGTGCCAPRGCGCSCGAAAAPGQQAELPTAQELPRSNGGGDAASRNGGGIGGWRGGGGGGGGGGGSAATLTEQRAEAGSTITHMGRRKIAIEDGRQVAAEKKAARLLTAFAKRRMRLQLLRRRRSVKGYLVLTARKLERPMWNLAVRARTWLLYHLVPYDLSIFGKIQTWQCVLLMLVGASPSWYLRACYFNLILLCLLPDLEEFQMIRFILSMKGTAAISGVINAVRCAIGLWQCTVFNPMTCHINGPGVGGDVFEQILCICWLQLLAWVAFMLLPFAGVRTEAGTPPPKRASLRRRIFGGGGFGGGGAKKPSSPSKPHAPHHTPHTPPQQQKPKKPKKTIDGYAELRDEIPRAKEDGSPVYDLTPTRCCDFSGDNRMVLLLFWDAFAFLCTGGVYVYAIASIAKQPNAHDPLGIFRDTWEERASCGGDLAHANRTDDLFAQPGDDVASHGLYMGFDAARRKHELSVWTGWQAEITFHVCRILFSISSFPFLFFMVPFLRTLFTHTNPTGYNQRGECVVMEPHGLSGFLSWLDGMLSRRTTRSKLLKADAERMRRKVRDGWQLLTDAPFSKKAHRKHQRELAELLEGCITHRHPLFRDFFPNQALTRDFEKRLAEAGLLSHKTAKLYEQRVHKESLEVRKGKRQWRQLKRQGSASSCSA